MTNRLILGQFDGTYLLRVSRPGFDAMDPNLRPSQLAFDSRWMTTLQVHISGNVTMLNNQVVIPHGLGYRPFVMIFLSGSAQFGQAPGNTSQLDNVQITPSALIFTPPSRYPRAAGYEIFYRYIIFTTDGP